MTDVVPAERVDNQGGCEKEKSCSKNGQVPYLNDLPSPSQEPLPEQLMKEAKTTRAIIFDCIPEGSAYEKHELWLPVSAVTKWYQGIIIKFLDRLEKTCGFNICE